MENVKNHLKHLYINYSADTQGFVWPSYRHKCLGTMEGFLLVLGVIMAGQPFQYKEVKKTFNLFGIIPINYTVTESYEDHILRLTYETIKSE